MGPSYDTYHLQQQPTFLPYLPSTTTTYLPTIPTIFNNNLPSYHTYHLQQQPEMSQISLLTLLLVGAAVDHAVCWSVGDIDPSIAGTYQYVSGAEKLVAQEGTLSDETKAAAAGAKFGFTVSLTANALSVKYNSVGGGNFAVKMKPGVPVVAGDATDEQMDTDTLSITGPNSVRLAYVGKNGGESGVDNLTFTAGGCKLVRTVNGVDNTLVFKKSMKHEPKLTNLEMTEMQ